MLLDWMGHQIIVSVVKVMINIQLAIGATQNFSVLVATS